MEHGADQPDGEFAYLVVTDFEATCNDNPRLHTQEIIELSSVILNIATRERVADHFREYVKPVEYPQLTDFCKKLTDIQQEQVDGGKSLQQALNLHGQWLKETLTENGGGSYAVVTWGDWGCRDMLAADCRLKQIDKPEYFNRWIDLKVPFQKAFPEAEVVDGGVRKLSLEEAMKLAGLAFVGHPHSGLDDALNIASLVLLLINRGVTLAITSPPPNP